MSFFCQIQVHYGYTVWLQLAKQCHMASAEAASES